VQAADPGQGQRGITARGGQAVRQQQHDPFVGGHGGQLGGRRAERGRQVGDAVPAQGQQVAYQGPGRAVRTLGLQDRGVVAERNDRGSEPAVSREDHARGGDRGDGHREARHRAAAVDEQAQRAAASVPGARDQVA